MSVPRWVWIVVSIGVVLVLGFIGLVGAGVYIVAKQVDVETASPASAEREFDEARARFAGQSPLISLDDRGRPNVIEAEPEVEGTNERINSLHVLAWDPEEDKIARVRIPFWLIRMKGTVSFGEFSWDRESLSVDDIERHGPGLIIDHTDRDGTRVLVWAE